MAINYDPTNWVEGKEFNPDNCNHWENGIKSACDGVDALESLPSDLARNGYGEQSGSKNIFDGNVVKGEYWDDSNGNTGVGSNWQRTDGLIKAKPSTTYYVIADGSISGSFGTACCYNANKEYLGYASPTTITAGNYRFDSLPNTSYVTLYWSMAWGDTKVCLSESNVYEPYYSSNKMLTEDTAEIASLKYLGWTVPREMPIKNYVSADGKFHQRVGRVDLGSLDWTSDSYAPSHFYTQLTGIKSYGESVKGNIWTSKYTTVTSSAMSNKTIASANGYIAIDDTAYTDATAFRSAMSGTYLYYELATEVVIAEGGEASALTSYDIEGLKLRKIGKMVWANFYAFNARANENVTVIPQGFRPIQSSTIMGEFYLSNSDTYSGSVDVGADGKLAFHAHTTINSRVPITSGHTLYACGCWYTEE